MKCHYCIAVLVFSQVLFLFVFNNFPNFFDDDIDHIREVVVRRPIKCSLAAESRRVSGQLSAEREGGREGGRRGEESSVNTVEPQNNGTLGPVFLHLLHQLCGGETDRLNVVHTTIPLEHLFRCLQTLYCGLK